MTRSDRRLEGALIVATSDRGSVLVDALVGLGVLTITLTLAAQAVQSGLHRSRRQEDVRMAQLVARSRLAAVGADIPLAAGRTTGVDGAMSWVVTVAPEGAGASLLAVSVEVKDGQGSSLADLQTLRSAGA